MESIQRTIQQAWTRFVAWFRGAGRGAQIGVAVGALIVICVCCTVGLGALGKGGASSTPTTGITAPQVTATATKAPQPTATLSPVAQLNKEVDDSGMLATRTGDVQIAADTQLIAIFIVPIRMDDQETWKAAILDVQKALWTGAYHVPDGWTVSVRIYAAPIGQPGGQVGFAYVVSSTAQKIAWSSVTPDQAWNQYDNKHFDS